MPLKTSLSSISLKFRAALLSIAADVPAARKLCGFKGHSAHRGCSRCLKVFPGGFGEKKDYSGFDRENWQPRTCIDHRSNARKNRKKYNSIKQEQVKPEVWHKLLEHIIRP